MTHFPNTYDEDDIPWHLRICRDMHEIVGYGPRWKPSYRETVKNVFSSDDGIKASIMVYEWDLWPNHGYAYRCTNWIMIQHWEHTYTTDSLQRREGDWRFVNKNIIEKVVSVELAWDSWIATVITNTQEVLSLTLTKKKPFKHPA